MREKDITANGKRHFKFDNLRRCRSHLLPGASWRTLNKLKIDARCLKTRRIYNGAAVCQRARDDLVLVHKRERGVFSSLKSMIVAISRQRLHQSPLTSTSASRRSAHRTKYLVKNMSCEIEDFVKTRNHTIVRIRSIHHIPGSTRREHLGGTATSTNKFARICEIRR